MIASPAKWLSIPAFAVLLALNGCGTYRNATAYFNTYYNASRLFDQAVAEMLKTPQTAKDSNYFAPYKVAPAVVTKFEKVIEKGSRVIQFHGESGYVEDAIMMIGKAYLYQNETESAAGKFRELIENFPSSDQIHEARLWRAKALYQGKNDEEALVAAKELVTAGTDEGGDIPGDILLEVTMLEAQIYADRGEFTQASEALARAEAIDGDDALKAVAQFQLGIVYEKTGEFSRAADAFGRVEELSPPPVMRFNARLRRGVMLSLSGRPDEALETFDEIIEWPLKPDQSALVDLEIANAYWVRGDSAAAFTLYEIIDSTYRRTDAAARAYLKRGEILEKQYRDLRGARKYYEKAKSEFLASSATLPASERFTALDRHAKTAERLARDDSTLHALLNPATRDTAGGDSGAVIAAAPRDSARIGTPLSAEAIVGDDDTVRVPQEDVRPPPSVSAATLSMRAIRQRPRHLVPDPEDSGFTPPTADEAQVPEPGDSSLASTPPLPGGQKAPAAPGGIPAAVLTPEQLSRRIAEHEYELGGIFLLDLELPDSALAYYRKVVDDHPESPLIPKALYALSEVHKIMGDTAAVDSLHRRLLSEYPETDYALQVRRHLGLDTAATTESPDEIRYRTAQEALFAGDSERALLEFKALSGESHDTVVAPRATYAVGWTYENVVRNLDSAEVWYKLLLRHYPRSVYAANAEPRVAVRGDTSRLKQYVKFKPIEAVPKPTRGTLGQVPRQQQPAGKNAAPVRPGEKAPPVDPEEDEYFNPGDDDEEEEAEPAEEEEVDDPGDDEPPPDDDDPGLHDAGGRGHQGMPHIPL